MTPPKPPRLPGKFTLPQALHDRLRAASEATGIPMSRIVEQGLRARLAEIEAAAKPTENAA